MHATPYILSNTKMTSSKDQNSKIHNNEVKLIEKENSKSGKNEISLIITIRKNSTNKMREQQIASSTISSNYFAVLCNDTGYAADDLLNHKEMHCKIIKNCIIEELHAQ